MLDVEALEAAGFRKALSQEEWADYCERVDKVYGRSGDDPRVAVDYVLTRGDVVIRSEQNTQLQTPFGLQTTVQYPAIAVIESADQRWRVTCDASNTDLVLSLVHEVERSMAVPTRHNQSSARRPE